MNMDPPADQANLHDVSYPSRCWILISEIREYERNRTNLNFFDQFGDFNPIGGMLISAEVRRVNSSFTFITAHYHHLGAALRVHDIQDTTPEPYHEAYWYSAIYPSCYPLHASHPLLEAK